MRNRKKVVIPEIIIEGKYNKMMPKLPEPPDSPAPPEVPQLSYEDSNVITSFFHGLRLKRMLRNENKAARVAMEQTVKSNAEIGKFTPILSLFKLQQESRLIYYEAEKAKFELEMMRKDAEE